MFKIQQLKKKQNSMHIKARSNALLPLSYYHHVQHDNPIKAFQNKWFDSQRPIQWLSGFPYRSIWIWVMATSENCNFFAYFLYVIFFCNVYNINCTPHPLQKNGVWIQNFLIYPVFSEKGVWLYVLFVFDCWRIFLNLRAKIN